MISLSSNYPVLADQQAVFKSITDSHCTTYNEWFTVKPAAGNQEDRHVAAGWISRSGPAISTDRVFMAISGHQAIIVALLAASLQGTAIAVDEFTYSNFLTIARLLNIQLIGCKTDEKGMLPSALEAASAQHNVRGIYIMPTVNNPTGVVMPLERRLELIDIARKNGQIIIDDDAYGFLDDNPPANFAQLAPDLGWYIYSLSKPFAPDVKVAFIAAPEQYKEQIIMLLKLTSSNPSTFFTRFVSTAITSGELEKLILRKREEGKYRQMKTREVLSGFEVYGHENGFHCWLKLPAGITSAVLYASLLQAGVEVMPGTIFAAPGVSVGEYIRIAMGAERDMSRVTEGLEIIKKLIC
ncbi:aminotransferase-like domain-containing protein [Chitinophaga filiformis]|uniref:DNA-binding transcriptional regulator, MocR family, contains an aminotransferase domain n=1 Tax=Chitinophaga filiformis TaxID=104663 RepID=A0A1G7QZ83_CHIFI|nr:PLP-dependent aminotransferase family protein [Chitinophaga filiformis]SDG03199.1 DNA-binding transcriptional regulator, MocR family, contains an aminotransferase domain [Chitinophaga filiformis]